MKKIFLLTLLAILMCSMSAFALVTTTSFSDNLTNITATGWTVHNENVTINSSTSPVIINSSTFGNDVFGTIIDGGAVAPYDFNLSAIINQSATNETDAFLLGTGVGLGDGEDLQNGTVGCVVAYANFTGTQDRYLILYNQTRSSYVSGPTLYAQTNESYGLLTLQYINSTSNYTCTFGNATLSGVGTRPSTFIGPHVLLTHETNGAGPGSPTGNMFSYFYSMNFSTAYTMPVPIVPKNLTNFTENCNGALNTSFWNKTLSGVSSFLDGSETGVGKWYVNGTNSSSGRALVTTYDYVRYLPFNYSVDVEFLNSSIGVKGGYNAGLTIFDNTNESKMKTCSIANIADYGLLLLAEDYQVSESPANYTVITAPLNGTLQMYFNNNTNKTYCVYNNYSISFGITLPESTYSVGVFGNFISISVNESTGFGAAYFDNIAFSYLSEPYTPPTPTPSTPTNDNPGATNGMVYVLIAFGVFATIISAAVILGIIYGGASFDASMIIGLVIVLALGTAILIAILTVLSNTFIH